MGSVQLPPVRRPKPIEVRSGGLFRRLFQSIAESRRRRVTVLRIGNPARPARRYVVSHFTLWFLAILAVSIATPIAYRVAEHEATRLALQHQVSVNERLVAERNRLLDERERQQEQLVRLAFDVQRLRSQVDQLKVIQSDIEALLAEGPANVTVVITAASEFDEGLDGVGGGDISEEELRGWVEETLRQATGDATGLIQSMTGLRESVVAYNHKLDHTPSIWPVEGRVTSEFGSRIHPITGQRDTHHGIDIAAPAGTKVVATAAGRVVLAEYYGGYGYAVIIDHGYGLKTLYGHNSRLAVKAGDVVKKGDVIAYVGSTGVSTGPHVHYEVIRVDARGREEKVNPRAYLP